MSVQKHVGRPMRRGISVRLSAAELEKLSQADSVNQSLTESEKSSQKSTSKSASALLSGQAGTLDDADVSALILASENVRGQICLQCSVVCGNCFFLNVGRSTLCSEALEPLFEILGPSHPFFLTTCRSLDAL